MFVKANNRKLIFEEDALRQFAIQFKLIRTSKGYTQESLSYKSNITLSQIARIETFKINPTLSTIFVLCKALEVAPEDVFKNIELKK